jgi:pyruvate dehydrogenase E1 component
MSLDGYVHQVPDTDPGETEEWLDSLDAVIGAHGPSRARYLLARLTERARQRDLGVAPEVSTPYVNTIPTDQQPWFPGDEVIEKQIRRYIRWNAAVMVVRANRHADAIGGHLSTFASSAALYEVGFNHFFRGKSGGQHGDHVYIQGHAASWCTRAFLECRLDEAHSTTSAARSTARPPPPRAPRVA